MNWFNIEENIDNMESTNFVMFYLRLKPILPMIRYEYHAAYF